MILVAVAALALWLCRRRVPIWLLVIQAPAAAVFLAVMLTFAPPAAASMFSLFYLLVVLYGTFFFRFEMAALLVVLCSLCFALALILQGYNHWLPHVVVVFGTSITVGALTGLVVSRFHERSFLDPLTGLMNRRLWESLVDQELKKSGRSGKPFSVLLLDLDGFKAINDRLGHLEGDRILQQVANTLHDVLRDADAPCRWGGDEFAALLVDCDADKAESVAGRIRAQLMETFELSMGLATWHPGGTLNGLFRQADESLYRDKRRSN